MLLFDNSSFPDPADSLNEDTYYQRSGDFEQGNCSETVRNVTLVATSLRRDHTYVLVSELLNILYENAFTNNI